MQEDRASAAVHFGGPDLAPRALRDVLLARIRAVPPGGGIDWATYYFRDEGLAQALIDASDRGVRVRLCLDGAPRRRGANDRVLARLRAHGLGGGLAVLNRAGGPFHLHAKVYAFSGPEPCAFIGSFNPSGNEPEDPAVVAAIGDQDRGHNLLVELRDPVLLDGLHAYLRRLAAAPPATAIRLGAEQNAPVEGADTRLLFFPRVRPDAVEQALQRADGQTMIRACISHLKRGPVVEALSAAVRRGAHASLLVHSSARRVGGKVMARLERAGVRVRAYRRPDDLPMHAKFLLLESPAWSQALFGSFNMNLGSRLLNHEVLALSQDAALIRALRARFDSIEDEIERDYAPPSV